MRVNFVNRDYAAVTVRWSAGASNGSFSLLQVNEYEIDGGPNDIVYAWAKASNNIQDGEFQKYCVTAQNGEVVFGDPSGLVI